MSETLQPKDAADFVGQEGETVIEEDKENETKKRYGHLIVFGFGAKPRTKEEAAQDPDRKEDMGWHLTVGTKARVLAAGELWEMGEMDDG